MSAAIAEMAAQCCTTGIAMLISPSHDVTLVQILHGKGSTYFGNSDCTSHSIISHSGLESFIYTNRILTKLC